MNFQKAISLWKSVFYLFHSLYFNLKYFPFLIAIKLPVLVYKPIFRKLKGNIKIEGPIKFGMVTLGFYRVPIYPDTGIMLENSGEIIFKGACKIGNGSAISVGKGATLIFGENFNSTCQMKCTCANLIEFGKNCLVGWDSLFSDTDWHMLKYVNGGGTRGYGVISIGHDVWFANGCRIYKNTIIPNYTVVSANSVISCKLETPEYSVIGTQNYPTVRKTGVWHNVEDDKIKFSMDT